MTHPMPGLMLGGFLLVLSAVPAAGQVFISELMVGNETTYCDRFGGDPDWVELRNPGKTPVDLGGWLLSDRPSPEGQKHAFRIPKQTTIGPGQYLLIFLSGQAQAPGDSRELHTRFRLDKKEGETLSLRNAKNEVVDRIQFSKQEPDTSLVRTAANERPTVARKGEATPGAANDGPRPPSRCAPGRATSGK